MKSAYRYIKDTANSFFKLILAILFGAILMVSTTTYAEDSGNSDTPVKDMVCTGEFINPIDGMCWSCVMPIGISSIFYKGKQDGTKDLTGWEQYLCTCDLYIGVPISFYEPARMIDVTAKPYCMVGLGGVSIADTGSFDGDTMGFAGDEFETKRYEFYQAHYYINPVMYIIGQALDNSKCFEQQGFDIGYITEVDPSWQNHKLANYLSPDGALYGNLPAVLACVGDCAASTAHFGVAMLHWCAGCNGLMYPLTGHVDDSSSTMETSGVIQARLMSKLHRTGIALSYYGNDGLCGGYRQILMNKRQYKSSMVFPVSQTKSTVKAMNEAIAGSAGATDGGEAITDGAGIASVDLKKQKQCCQPFGRTAALWGIGRYYPVKGEDMSFQIYRKRDCCQKVYGYGD